MSDCRRTAIYASILESSTVYGEEYVKIMLNHPQWWLYRCEFKQGLPIVLVEYLRCCQSVEQARAILPNLVWQRREDGVFVSEPEPILSQSTRLEYYSIEQR